MYLGALTKNGSNLKVLGVFTLTMINVAAIASLRGLPSMAEYGLSAIFFYIIAAVFFLIPIALVSAELATGWPERGGVYIWVTQALGPRLGFLAIWLQWIQNLIWFPVVLTFGAATLAFVFKPELASNKYYMLTVVLAMYWGATLINFVGMKASGWISTVGVIGGTIIPGVILILMAFAWDALGDPSQVQFTKKAFFPNVSHFGDVVIAIGVLLTTLTGIEMSATHAQEAKNPQRDYPRAIFFSTIIILAIAMLGVIAILTVIPAAKVNIVAGYMDAVTIFFDKFHVAWLIPVIAFMAACGSFGQITTWVPGPSKGLLAVARKGYLPPYFQKVNKKGVQVRILVVQACIVTVISLVFVVMPSVGSSYVILSILTAQLYLTMYILMFIAAIRLRYTQPDKKRAYRVPFKNVGMWIVAGTGILAALFAIAVAYFPPAQMKTGSLGFYEGFLIIGFIVMSAPPLIIYALKRPSWKATE